MDGWMDSQNIPVIITDITVDGGIFRFADLWGQCAPDTVYSPAHHLHIALLHHSNSLCVHVHDGCVGHNACVLCYGRHHWHRSGVYAFYVCGRPGLQQKDADSLKQRERV